MEAIEEGIDVLLCGIQKQLKSKSTTPTVIPFRHDVFRYFFNGKGKPSIVRNSLLKEMILIIYMIFQTTGIKLWIILEID